MKWTLSFCPVAYHIQTQYWYCSLDFSLLLPTSLSLSLFLLKFNERVNQLEICYKLKWYFTMRNRVYVRFPFLYYVTVTVNFDYVVFLFNQIRHQRINHDHHQHYWLYNQSCRVKMTVEGVWCLCVLVCLWVCVGGWVSEWVEEE